MLPTPVTPLSPLPLILPGENFLYCVKGGLRPPAPAAGGRKRPSSPVPSDRAGVLSFRSCITAEPLPLTGQCSASARPVKSGCAVTRDSLRSLLTGRPLTKSRQLSGGRGDCGPGPAHPELSPKEGPQPRQARHPQDHTQQEHEITGSNPRLTRLRRWCYRGDHHQYDCGQCSPPPRLPHERSYNAQDGGKDHKGQQKEQLGNIHTRTVLANGFFMLSAPRRDRTRCAACPPAAGA